MSRPTCPRKVGFTPSTTYFKPAGTPVGVLEEVLLGQDELEATRLKNLVGLSQEQAASQMGVSQPTFHRLLVSAHQKLTDAVVNGKALRIEGGNVTSADVQSGPCQWRRGWGCRTKPSTNVVKGNLEPQTDESGSMAVAIASVDGTLEGKVDERFGRARKIVLYDMTTKKHSVIDNANNLNAAQGAGIQTAQNVVKLGAKAVISGHFGPKAYRAIQMAGLEVYSATDMTVNEAIKRFKKGKLIKLAGADVAPRWK
jgi:predicted DNA-binding protein (UPF0251 family)/predicted Fe-Mo cluster-binding NifX family protein